MNSVENIPNIRGLVLVEAARTLRTDQGIKFMMKRHWIRIWFIVIFLSLIALIMWMI